MRTEACTLFFLLSAAVSTDLLIVKTTEPRCYCISTLAFAYILFRLFSFSFPACLMDRLYLLSTWFPAYETCLTFSCPCCSAPGVVFAPLFLGVPAVAATSLSVLHASQYMRHFLLPSVLSAYTYSQGRPCHLTVCARVFTGLVSRLSPLA